jgi:hypothetical protein
LDELIAYAKLFSQKIGHTFTPETIRLTAMTGSAATEIGGKTTASVYKYMRNTKSAIQEEIKAFSDTRLNIIDEISFADYEKTLTNISTNLKNFTQCPEYQYGSQAICFLGDFCQLACIGGTALYKFLHGIYWESALTCMVELKGIHRFKKCPVMQQIMTTIRENGLDSEDRKILNSRIIDGINVHMPDPNHTRFATFFNKRRCHINALVFKQYLKKYHNKCTKENICNSALVIKAMAKWALDMKPLTFHQQKFLFEKRCEADIEDTFHNKCDPLLCLFDGCNLMGNENDDVEHGIANGTTCLFRKAKLKPDKHLHPIRMYDYWVNSVSIEDVEYLELQWQDSSRFVGTFRIFPKKKKYRVLFPFSLNGQPVSEHKTPIYLTQFPVIINHATTGHKLQGKSMDALVIAEWSEVENWAYVCLSRVRTLDGLYFITEIPETISFKPDAEYLAMMQRLRNTILATEKDVQEMKSTLNISGLYLL